MRSQRQEFLGADGQKLASRLDVPDGDIRAYAMFAHCFTCGKDVFAASRIAQALTEHGFAVLRFDFTGLGASEGEFANTNFSSNLADLLAAAGQVPEAKAVVTLAAPSDPVRVTGLFSQHLDQIASEGEAQVQLAGRPFRIKQQFVEDAGGHNLKLKIAGLKRALLVMHAPGDDTVGISNAMEIFTAAKHPKSFISLD